MRLCTSTFLLIHTISFNISIHPKPNSPHTKGFYVSGFSSCLDVIYLTSEE